MKEKISMVLFVLIMGTFFAGLLTAVNEYTAPKIERNQRLRLIFSVLEALEIEHPEEAVEAEHIFDEKVVEKEIDGRTVFESDAGRALLFFGSGLWGPIEGVIALEEDFETIRALTIIHQVETPGLGGRIEEEQFLSGFRGKKFSPRLEITGEGEAQKNHQVDGITGATMTVDALEEMINRRLREFEEEIQ